MKNIIKIFVSTLIIASVFSSCKKDEKSPENPGNVGNPTEIITTVKLELTDSVSGELVSATWKDADGDGPGQPVITGLNLKPDRIYHGQILLLDESKSPVDTVSQEVEEEKNAHQFYYMVTGSATGKVAFSKTDMDDNNMPVGLTLRVFTTPSAASSGSLKVLLKHYDGIAKSTDPTVGETDVEADFPLQIQ